MPTSTTELLESASGPLSLLNPTPSVLEALLSAYEPDDPRTAVYAPATTYKSKTRRFPTELEYAQVLADGPLTLNAVPADHESLESQANVFVGTDATWAAVYADGPQWIQSASDSLQAQAQATVDTVTSASEPFELGVPPLPALLERFADRAGDQFTETYQTFLSRIDPVSTQYGRGPAVAAGVLVGALTETQLYHVSRAAEDVGLASVATHTRIKQGLAEAGYVTTQKVSVPQGRPRQQLQLTANVEPTLEVVVGIYEDWVAE